MTKLHLTLYFFFYCILHLPFSFFFFFNDTATTEIYTLSLHDALPISRQADDHNDEALQPHADIHDDGHEEQDHHIVAHLVGPEQLRHQDVRQNQRKVKRSIRTVEPLLDEEDVKLVAAVKRQEELEKIAISDDEPGGQHDLGHVVQVPHGDEIFEGVGFAQRNRDGQNHGEARIDGPGHEVRRKDCGVPAGTQS